MNGPQGTAEAVTVETGAVLPLVIAEWAQRCNAAVAVFVARDEAVLQRLAAELPNFAGDRRVLRFPGWDSLPYDRARPSRALTGARVATLSWLSDETQHPAILLATPEAMLQRVPTKERIRERSIRLRVGQDADVDWLRRTLVGFGYSLDERVDEPGKATIHGGTVDAHLAAETTPLRLELADGRIASLRWFDPITQRSLAEAEDVLLLPATEAFTIPGEDVPASREALLPDGPLATVFDYLPDAAIALTETAEERFQSWADLVQDSFQIALAAHAENLTPPDRLYTTLDELRGHLSRSTITYIAEAEAAGEPPVAAATLQRRVMAAHKAGRTVVVCGNAPIGQLQAAVSRRLSPAIDNVHRLADWSEVADLPARSVAVLQASIQSGFERDELVVLALRRTDRSSRSDTHLEELVGSLRIGDLVVDAERGLARLDRLVMEEQAGAPLECLHLQFLRGEGLLLPATEIDRIWRYGSTAALRPDRLDHDKWLARRAEIEAEIRQMAGDLVARVRARAERSAPVLERNAVNRRFVRRMPFAPTPDQVAAIRAVQQDLVSGRPMLRMICGDVGFGKTEVALHAAAIAALAGKQVAIAAPTTILARQHFETFRRRLGPFGIRVESLIRSTTSAENKAVLQDLAAGRAHVVVGTHAVAAARFQDLGLVIIDEEQRFGDAQKQRLRHVQEHVHTLIMTATPLPRSLQTGLVGLVDVSLLTTPPAARLPVQGFVVPFDPVVVRAALLHEQRRGGQSFFVCPRIEDIDKLLRQLRDLVPELSIAVAHGRMQPEALDKAMLGFANGNADILLCTSIIEAGLDLPNANTMLIWRPDRFGLAQLHQLRGRVGRGRVRAKTYLLTDPEHPPADAARKRLETVIALDNLGAGFAISLADLDQRGAGDLLGNAQAGHIKLIGTELYRDILQRVLTEARGEPVEDDWRPEIVIDAPAFIPEDFVPEPDTRLALYRHVAALHRLADVDDTATEFDDRFGDLPAPFTTLLTLSRLRIVCRNRGVTRVQAGPAGIAVTLRKGATTAWLGDADRHDDRYILPIKEARPTVRLQRLLEFFTA